MGERYCTGCGQSIPQGRGDLCSACYGDRQASDDLDRLSAWELSSGETDRLWGFIKRIEAERDEWKEQHHG